MLGIQQYEPATLVYSEHIIELESVIVNLLDEAGKGAVAGIVPVETGGLWLWNQMVSQGRKSCVLPQGCPWYVAGTTPNPLRIST